MKLITKPEKHRLQDYKKNKINCGQLTPWLMEPGGSLPHSQGLSNNSYPEPNQPNSPH